MSMSISMSVTFAQSLDGRIPILIGEGIPFVCDLGVCNLSEAHYRSC